MSDSAARSASTGSGEGWLRPSLNSSASPALRRDSKNTLYNSSSSQGSPKGMLPLRPSLQGNDSRRTSLSGAYSTRPSYVSDSGASRLPSLTQQSRHDGQLGFYQYRRQGSMSYTQSLTSSRATGRVPIASPDNDYLGFCKGAWKLQNGDRKGAFEKCKEAQSWSRNASRSTTLAQHLQCSQNKCAFRSNYVSNDGDLIYEKVILMPEKGIKLRWTFLAKSHVPQKVVIRNQYAFKCLFCVFMGLGGRAGVYVGTDYYLDHINADHRGQAMGEVLLFKTNCVNDRIADNDDDFDINLWPLDVSRDDKTQQWLSDSLLGVPARMPRLPPDDSLGVNEPWILDPAAFQDFDANADVNSEDGKATVTTAIHRSSQGHEGFQRRPSTHSEVSTPSTVVPASLPASAQRQSPERYTYESWEDNPEEIWGARQITSEEQQAPVIPARSNARLTSIREAKDVLGRSQQASWLPSLSEMQQHSRSPVESMGFAMPAPNPMGITGEDDLAITTCLKTIIDAFRDAQIIVEDIRRQPRLGQMELFPMLEESIFEAPDEIDREWQRGVTRFGLAFEMGDYVAIIALQQTTIALHSKLVDALRIVASGKPTDLGQLMDVADSGRHHVISTLHELRKRLVQAPPSLMSASNGFAGESAMSPEPQPQRSNSTPQHVSHLRPDLWKDPYFPDPTDRNAATPKNGRARSDATADTTTRRGSVLNNFSKPKKWGRKISLSKSPGQSNEDVVDKLAESVKAVELDSTPVMK